MRDVIAAIREAFPKPTNYSPVQYFSMCWRRCATLRRRTEKRTVLFAQAKFVNDLKGRFLQLRGEVTRNPILRSAPGDGHRFRHREGSPIFIEEVKNDVDDGNCAD